MRESRTWLGVLLAVAAAAPLFQAGCGSAARAEPIEVTYYYLPG